MRLNYSKLRDLIKNITLHRICNRKRLVIGLIGVGSATKELGGSASGSPSPKVFP